MSNHFTDENWSDFARDLSPADESAVIEQHLEKGCESCERASRLWRTVAQIANGEIHSEVPEDLVQASQRIYAAWSRRYLVPRRAQMAKLIFDSLLQPLPAGVRGETPLPRRVIERAGHWLVDLRFEPTSGKRMFLAGQVLSPKRSPREAGNLAIILMRSDVLVEETSANPFGEFQLQFDQSAGLRIYIDIPGRQPIGILLPDPDSPPGTGKPPTD
jgi:hypothetical protein